MNKGVDQQKEAILSEHVMKMKQELAARSPKEMALRTGAVYDADNQEFRLQVFGKTFLVHYPDFEVREAGNEAPAKAMRQALLVYYFRMATGAPATGRWISFRELPGGMNYERAFQGYSGDALARALKGNVARFKAAAEALDGVSLPMADAAYTFWALPKVPVAVVFWEGDEEFPAKAQVLFDAASHQYLPTDGFAGLGAEICRLLQQAAQAKIP